MNADNIVRSLRLLWRADKVIAEVRLRHMLVGFGLLAFAALISAFGLLMFEMAAYFALVQLVSAIAAAAILGAVNLVIALILVVIASRRSLGQELTLANEIHDTAIEALQTRGASGAIAGRSPAASSARRRVAADRPVDHGCHQPFAQARRGCRIVVPPPW